MSRVVKFYESVNTDEVVEISVYDVEEDGIEELMEDVEVSEDETTISLKETKVQAEAILAKANAQAKKILADANTLALAIQKKSMEEAQQKIHQLEDQALREGYAQGFQRKSDEIGETLQTIHREMRASINYLKQQNSYIVKQQEEQLKFLAVEVASKILRSRLDEDPMVLEALVQDVLLLTKKSKRIHIELPENANELMLQLEEEFRSQPIYQGRNMNVETKNQPPGSVFVETDMGLYDVSVDTQLENLKKLFMEFES